MMTLINKILQNLNLNFILSAKTTTYTVIIFLIPLVLFLIFGLILSAAYKKKNQIAVKGFFVSFLINYNVWFLLLLVFYILHTRATEHIVRDTPVLNPKVVIAFYLITVIFDFSVLIAWFAAPARLNPNSWQWLWAMRESSIQAKYERERERKIKEYQEQLKAQQVGNGASASEDSKKGKKKAKKIDDLLYRYLGLDTDCSEDEIKTAYRSLAKKYHPDTSTEENAVEKFMKIQKAYEILNDPQKRQAYDQTGKY